MSLINLSTRLRFVNDDGTLTPEAYRSLTEIINRTGGALGSSGDDTFVTGSAAAIDTQSGAMGDTFADAVLMPALNEMTAQPATSDALGEMVMQPASEPLLLDLPSYPTASAPAYKKGRLYFDTTLNKARIGGATAYETITSA